MASPLARVRAARRLSGTWVRSTVGGARQRDAFADVDTYCMFIGYPRSGHSLVGSLLNAHPQAVISHELDTLRYLRLGFRRPQIWSLILENDRRFAARGQQTKHEYSYPVPGQWQGRFEDLRVIGDKKGHTSTLQVRDDPELLERLREAMKVRVRMIHVIRNPYDNIATMLRRGEPTLAAAVRAYFDLCESTAGIRGRLADGELLDLRHEQLLAEPAPSIEALVEHVGLHATAGYVEACAGILFPEPRRTRASAPWTPELRAEVLAGIDRHDFLAGYTFDS